MATANDLILGALKRINAYAPGETLANDDAIDALDALNEWLDSQSTDESSVPASSENILTFVPGQYQYTIGNYAAGTFPGIVSVAGTVNITGATIPTDLIARADISGAGIPAGTTIVSVNQGAGTAVMSAAATLTPGIQQISYTIPGDFKIPRPLRVSNSFTRINTPGTSGLDYPIEIVDQQQYIQIGYKAISAPWPIAAWYNPTYPLGNIYFYQNPSGAGSLHLFTDNILTRFETLTQQVSLPQGYVRWIKWALAKELAPEYGKAWTQTMEANWKAAQTAVRSLNQMPTPVANYDAILLGGPRTDAGWILSGGCR
jgi:hypothetical protein